MDPISSKTALAAAGAAGAEPLYVDDVFSTYLYDGNNNSAVTVTNGVDLSGEGGLVWVKNRDTTQIHILQDTENGTSSYLTSTSTAASTSISTGVTSFNSDGFTVGSTLSYLTSAYASWTFRKAPGFFDVVTYTGTGSAQNISHSLGSVPGMILIKCTSDTFDWSVYHRSLGATKNMHLNNTSVADTQTGVFNDTEPTATHFTVNYDGDVNGNNKTYVAYVFAHDDQSFGTAGNESVIKCGSYTGNSSSTGPIIDLGFEPQWVLIKSATTTGDWGIADVMRGQGVDGSSSQKLKANSSNTEQFSNFIKLNPTGFQLTAAVTDLNGTGNTYIYMAIRRPHKPPEAGTDVFTSAFRDASEPGFNSTFPVDLAFEQYTTGGNSNYPGLGTRLAGQEKLTTSSTGAEVNNTTYDWDYQDGWNNVENTNYAIFSQMFKRAPGFMDVVAWAGDGTSNRAISHNLTVTPELLITKRRTNADSWWTQYTGIFGTSNGIRLDSSAATNTGASAFNGTSAATSSAFYVSSDSTVNGSGDNYVAALFATLPGISKVGTYTGTGSAINVDCGFTAGARYILIKRTDSTGDWYVWDALRGIYAGSGNDPYLLLNSTAAHDTNNNYVDALNAGFTVNASAPAALNASGGTYLFLAIA